MSHKNILLCLYYYDPYISGLTIYAKNLAENLVKKGHKVTIFCAKHKKDLASYEIINGVEIYREPVLFSLGKGIIMPLYWLKVIFLSRKFDRVNFHFPNFDLGLSSLFIPKKKIFVTYHCDINLGKGFISWFIEKLSFLSMYIGLFRCRAIIGNSKNYFAHSIFKKFLFKFNEIYPPIDYKKIDEGTGIITNPSFHVQNTYKIGFMGRIVYEKGINYLIESINDPLIRDLNIHLFIGGDYKNIRGGSIKDALDILIYPIKEKVTFLGEIPFSSLKDFYQTIDILVLPSIDPLESFGMVQVEALYQNTPIIVSNLPGPDEVVRKTGYGLLVKPRSSSDLAQQIYKLYCSQKKYNILRQKNMGKTLVKKYYSIDGSIDNYLHLFTQK